MTKVSVVDRLTTFTKKQKPVEYLEEFSRRLKEHPG
jgi:hypothetical protein